MASHSAQSSLALFQSTCSVRSKTVPHGETVRDAAISIHLLRAEQDRKSRYRRGRKQHFNPLAPCGARLLSRRWAARATPISIHLLRAEQDSRPRRRSNSAVNFNPLAPCGARHNVPSGVLDGVLFQSTCSVRSKTAFTHRHAGISSNFNPLAPCGARPSQRSRRRPRRSGFQSTCSVRSKTANGHKNCLQRSFILHRSPPHKSNKRDFQQKKEPSRRKNGISLVRTHPGFGVN